MRGEKNYEKALVAWARLIGGESLGPKASTPVVTVADVVDAFLADAAGRMQANTIKTYSDCLVTNLKATFGDRLAACLTPDDLERWAAKKPWSSSYTNTVLTACVSAFKWAAKPRVGILTHNPVAGVRIPPMQSRGARAVVSDEDFADLLKECFPNLRDTLVLLRATGARPGEIVRVTAADVDFDHGIAALVNHKTARKTGRVRVVHFPPDSMELLRRLAVARPTGPLVRNWRGLPWKTPKLFEAVHRASERAGLEVAPSHFRHTFASRALAAGVPEAVVAALLGHTSTAMVARHYGHLTSQARVLQEAVKKVFDT